MFKSFDYIPPGSRTIFWQQLHPAAKLLRKIIVENKGLPFELWLHCNSAFERRRHNFSSTYKTCWAILQRYDSTEIHPRICSTKVWSTEVHPVKFILQNGSIESRRFQFNTSMHERFCLWLTWPKTMFIETVCSLINGMYLCTYLYHFLKREHLMKWQ